jgi:hypothetical protein
MNFHRKHTVTQNSRIEHIRSSSSRCGVAMRDLGHVNGGETLT